MRQFVLLLCTAGFLAGCVSQRPLEEAISAQEQQVDSLHSANRQLRQEIAVLRDSLQFYDDIDSGHYYRRIRSLEDRINRLEFEVITSLEGGVTVAMLPVDELFKPGTATLTDQATDTLAGIAQSLSKKYRGKIIRIEGHSDSVPVGGSLAEKYPSNWELSSARAAAVARYFIDQQEVSEDRVMVVGYGSSQPAASNATAQGRSTNRRVRIAALPLSPEEKSDAGTEQASNR